MSRGEAKIGESRKVSGHTATLLLGKGELKSGSRGTHPAYVKRRPAWIVRSPPMDMGCLCIPEPKARNQAVKALTSRNLVLKVSVAGGKREHVQEKARLNTHPIPIRRFVGESSGQGRATLPCPFYQDFKSIEVLSRYFPSD